MITLTALWTLGAGGHEILDLSASPLASRHLSKPEAHNSCKTANSRMTVILRYNKASPGPAVDADAVLGVPKVPLSSFPGGPPNGKAIHHFKKDLDQTVKDLIADWQRDARVAISERLLRREVARKLSVFVFA